MRHRKKRIKFSRSRAQRKALLRSLLRALIIHERIVTTTARAKYLRAEADKLITRGKHGRLSDRRLVYQVLGDHALVRRLFEAIVPRYPQSTGGYTRLLRVNNRKGDGAPQSLVELTRIEKKFKLHKEHKEAKAHKPTEEKAEVVPPKRDLKPSKGIASRVKNIFKKERDSL